MDEHISEIIKDLSEAFLAIVSSICLIITTARKKNPRSLNLNLEKGLKDEGNLISLIQL